MWENVEWDLGGKLGLEIYLEIIIESLVVELPKRSNKERKHILRPMRILEDPPLYVIKHFMNLKVETYWSWRFMSENKCHYVSKQPAAFKMKEMTMS